MPARKRALPKFPRRIGIVTSPSGAAIRDMLNVLRRRAPGVEVLINPVRVQGTGAALEIATAIRELSAPNDAWKPLDVLVVARGGGSIEDLWEFNEEIVARAIFHSADSGRLARSATKSISRSRISSPTCARRRRARRRS